MKGSEEVYLNWKFYVLRLDVAYLLGRDALAASVLLGQTVADKQSGKDKLGIVHKMHAANSYKWF